MLIFIMNDEHVSWLALADDVLCEAFQVRFQSNFDKFAVGLSRYGLNLNTSNCRILSMVASGRYKKVKIMNTPLLSVDGEHVHQWRGLRSLKLSWCHRVKMDGIKV